jgi:hypothetical protein
MFIGPTSQAPRVDEARDDKPLRTGNRLPADGRAAASRRGEPAKPWLVDRLLRNLLVDLTGNTHRAEFCIDKLYSPDGAAGRLGLLEFRAFEMPPHAQMSLLQMLLLRALVASFWKTPYGRPAGALGHAAARPLHAAALRRPGHEGDVRDLQRAPATRSRSNGSRPSSSSASRASAPSSIKASRSNCARRIEPWHVLGEEMSAGGTARYVDSSVERMQVKVKRHDDTAPHRHLQRPRAAAAPPPARAASSSPACATAPGARRRRCTRPSASTRRWCSTWSTPGAGVRSAAAPTTWPIRADATTRPSRSMPTKPRRGAFARFWDHGHTPGVRREGRNPDYPLTLDLRRAPEAWMEGPPGVASELGGAEQSQQ